MVAIFDKPPCAPRSVAGHHQHPRSTDQLDNGRLAGATFAPIPTETREIDYGNIWSLRADHLDARGQAAERGEEEVESAAGQASPAPSSLSRREREILQLVAEGYANARIARCLWVTEKTVKFHLSSIFRKICVRNRTEASRWAHEHGVVAVEGTDATASGLTAPVRQIGVNRARVARSELTIREREILGLVAEGCSNRLVARRLRVSEPTVKFHLANIYRKLSVTNRTEASLCALRRGLVGALPAVTLRAA
jgi:DNA-binding NarL/FixJ family response regulator